MADFYFPLRALHMTCAGLSIAGFLLRWLWMLCGSPALHKRVTKIAPHFIGTLLLLSAILLVLIVGFGASAAWLSAKIVGLVVYVSLGAFALKRGRTQTARAVFGVLAIATFAFIASVARSHDLLGFFRVLA
ncbi:hypothetical protein AWB67_02383 [Caballeronia terrestris]|jgi:uncharacterized membrane protein SirB2|uniref:Invasion gene expression up-regulator, SirB n=1 Tax=Caballeronia terrestris TaxID=1226301 RepID=A0A158I9B1_9BURK|nr:SirB2 family protein [Caballeronia terrestris]SAL53037.1 hypothetical protein AWB67_02383 [Caballeronia terrestris]